MSEVQASCAVTSTNAKAPIDITTTNRHFFNTVTMKLKDSAIPLRDFVWRNPAIIDQKLTSNSDFDFYHILKLSENLDKPNVLNQQVLTTCPQAC